MTKTIEDFNEYKIPRNRIARQQLLKQIFEDGYYAGVAEGRLRMKTEMAASLKAEETRLAEAKAKADGIRALSNMGDSLAIATRALTNVLEPRQI